MKVRPISDSAKELIFNTLRANYLNKEQQPVYTGRVADLFCGTGSLGLEALSRGAKAVTFIDRSIQSLILVTNNLKRLAAEATCVRADVKRLGHAEASFDLLFVDPPFNFGLATPCLERLVKNNWFGENTVCVLRVTELEQVTLPENVIVAQEKHDCGRILFLQQRKST